MRYVADTRSHQNGRGDVAAINLGVNLPTLPSTPEEGWPEETPQFWPRPRRGLLFPQTGYPSLQFELDKFQPGRTDVCQGSGRSEILPIELALPHGHAAIGLTRNQFGNQARTTRRPGADWVTASAVWPGSRTRRHPRTRSLSMIWV